MNHKYSLGCKLVLIYQEFQTFIGQIHIHVNPVCSFKFTLKFQMQEQELTERTSTGIVSDLEDISRLSLSGGTFWILSTSVHKVLEWSSF